MTWAVVNATEEHARLLAPKMADPDKHECWAQAHMEPLEALLFSVKHSIIGRTALVDAEPSIMFGVMADSPLAMKGFPWLLARDLSPYHSYLFLRNYEPFLAEMLALFPKLEAEVDARHERALRWMKWAGFEIKEPIPRGPDGLLFHPVMLGA